MDLTASISLPLAYPVQIWLQPLWRVAAGGVGAVAVLYGLFFLLRLLAPRWRRS